MPCPYERPAGVEYVATARPLEKRLIGPGDAGSAGDRAAQNPGDRRVLCEPTS